MISEKGNKTGLPASSVYRRYFGKLSIACELAAIPMQQPTIYTNCKQCQTDTSIVYSRLNDKRRKSKNVFCSKSCATSYNNTHKKYGTRRSKFEVFCEEKLKDDFPRLKIDFNSKTVIDSEIDIYFPELRLAIELNGIVHYEPIYGTETFERIINNDMQKGIQCYKSGIELATINVSKLSREKQNEEYYSHIKTLIEQNLGRLPRTRIPKIE